MSGVDLVQWLTAQLDEDERIARTTASEFGATWTVDGETVGSEIEYVSVVDEPASPIGFIAAHDPARVLREIEAKRDLLRIAERAHDYHETFTSGFASALEGTLRLFALAYADRPGYKAEEWAP